MSVIFTAYVFVCFKVQSIKYVLYSLFIKDSGQIKNYRTKKIQLYKYAFSLNTQYH